MERCQVPDFPDAGAARRIRSRTKSARLSLSLWLFTLSFAFLRDEPAAGFDELRTLIGFYMSCRGGYDAFLFRDPADCEITGQYLGIGDSSATVFQLQRTMGTKLPGGGFAEPIVAPNNIHAIYFDGIIQNSANYTVDTGTGRITFLQPPPAGLVITADFSYWFRCRFLDDRSDFENFMYGLWQLKKLSFISVRP